MRPWTAHPAVHLPRILCGVRQTAPAWKRVEIRPQPAAGIDRAECLVPTPQGDLTVRWERVDGAIRLDVRAPNGQRADIRLGDQRKLLASGGRARLSAAG